jgi:tetratricopeptide (TPR) repeat protein
MPAGIKRKANPPGGLAYYKREKNMSIRKIICAAVLPGVLLLSCASYGIGGGYTNRTQKLENPHRTEVNLTDNNFSLYLNGSYTYFESSLGFHKGTIAADGGGANETMDASGVSLGSYFKLPFVINQFISPVVQAGAEYQWFNENKAGIFWKQLDNDNVYIGDLAIKFGAGLDVSFSKSFFVRGRVFYAPPILSEKSELSFQLGLGYRTDNDDAKDKWKTKEARTAETVNSQGQLALDKKDYERAIALYTRGIAAQKNNYTYYYKRSEAHAGAGDYAAALDDFNSATRINPVLQGSTGYKTWKQLVADYEKETGQDAPMDGQGKVVIQSSVLKIADHNASTSWAGSGNGVSYPEGQHTFTFWYENGADKSREAVFTFQVEAGHVYSADAVRNNFIVTITIADATERELRGGNETKQIASRSVEIIVQPLPSDLALPSWARQGLTESQVRNRMSSAPLSTSNNMHIYKKGREAVMYGFTFAESGAGLAAYSAIINGGWSTLNAAVNNFKKVTGKEPAETKDGGKSIYSWVLPAAVREDIVLLQVVGEDDTVFVKYAFLLDLLSGD